jgi:hypothetical protein
VNGHGRHDRREVRLEFLPDWSESISRFIWHNCDSNKSIQAH